MPIEPRQGLYKKVQLTEDERAEILHLADLCNAYEHLHMRLPLLMQHTSSKTVADDFLYYEHDTLMGYIAFDSEAMELTGMVHSVYRGHGYGRQILEEAICIAQAQQPDEIMLEVNIHNENALGLYLSCGFEINTTYEYYCMRLV